MKIRLLGAHICESQDAKLVSLLIDEFMAMDAGAITSSLSFQEQHKLKAILLTHQHYDHIRDVPTIAMNLFLSGATINVYSTLTVYNALTTYLMNNKLYPNFLTRPPDNPTIKFIEMEPYETKQIGGYEVIAVPVKHSVSTVGYQVTSSDGKAVFYTSDTGPDLNDCWECISPQLLITEVTASNRFEEFGRESGHLTPSLLMQELVAFQELKGYLPQVVSVHMNPVLQKEIEAELATVARELNSPITVGCEGMQIEL